MIWREDVVRMSLPAIRSAFPPRVFATLESVVLEAAHERVVVRLERQVGSSCFGLHGRRVWLICPRCGRRTVTVGYAYETKWGCARCAKWHGRTKPKWTRDSVPEPGPTINISG